MHKIVLVDALFSEMHESVLLDEELGGARNSEELGLLSSCDLTALIGIEKIPTLRKIIEIKDTFFIKKRFFSCAIFLLL